MLSEIGKFLTSSHWVLSESSVVLNRPPCAECHPKGGVLQLWNRICLRPRIFGAHHPGIAKIISVKSSLCRPKHI